MFRQIVVALTFVLFCSVGIAFSQQYSTPYVPSFHSAPAATTTFQFDLSNPIFTEPTITHEVLYRDSVATSWLRTTMALLYQTCTTYTYSGAINFTPSSNSLEYYFRSENDTAVVSMSPKNAANTFPVPTYLMADMGADPVGDATSGSPTNLDLTGMQMGYSDTKIYASLANVSGAFPTGQLPTYYLYGVGVISPDQTDSVGYAMVLVNINIPFVLTMTPGLYRINPADTSFTRVAAITYTVSGGALWMSCNVSDLTAQPGFGTWPPPSGFILTAPMSATATASPLGITTNDQGKSGIFVPSSHFLRFGTSNTAPTLSGIQMTTAGTHVDAQIAYSDANNDLPTLRELVFASQVRPMVACEKHHQSGTIFTDSLTVEANVWYPYYFRFSDGRDTVTTPLDSLRIQFGIRGDADNSGAIDISDAVYLISFIFSGGPAPDPLWLGDASCDGAVDISDAVFLVAYIFSGGPAPCDE